MAEAVSIVGGGVIGLSTGVWLEAVGYETRVYTEHRADTLAAVDAPPTVATPYAAASIIPHRDEVPHATAAFERSNEVLRLLADDPDWPVRQQRHVMVYEGDPGERPAFADGMPGFRRLDPDRDPVPTREGVEVADVDGWSFEPFFVSMPQYGPRLGQSYRSIGGTIEQQRVSRDDLTELPGDVVVNATGLGAAALVDDPALHPVKGHLVLVEGASGLTHDGAPASYNYYYSGTDGDWVPVYAYPREGELVLGGSKLRGRFVDGEWQGEDDRPTTTVGAVEVPARILDVNEQLLDGVSLAPERLTAIVGYRPGRDGGARIEWDELDGTPVIHNYGHGGAGITYSWGSAALVASLLEAGADAADGATPTPADLPGDLAAKVRDSDRRPEFEGT